MKTYRVQLANTYRFPCTMVYKAQFHQVHEDGSLELYNKVQYESMWFTETVLLVAPKEWLFLSVSPSAGAEVNATETA